MKNTLFRRIFAICLASAVLAATGSTAISAQADEAENTTASNTEADGNGASSMTDEEYLAWEREHFKDYGLGADIDEEDIDPENSVGSVSEYNSYRGRPNLRMASPLPAAVDNTTNENARFFPPIDSQGGIGSCSAWANTYYLYTYMRNRAHNETTTAENTFSPMWTYNLYSCGEDAGSNAISLFNIMKTLGVVTIQDAPIKTSTVYYSNYLDWHATDDIWARATENRITGYVTLSSATDGSGPYYPVNMGTPITSAKDSDLDVFKTALSNGEILTYSTYFYGWDAKRIKYTSAQGVDNSFVGEWAATACTNYNGGHAMTIVGYNDNIWIDINENDQIDSGEMGAFKVANSHGDDYRNGGYSWVAYDALNQVSSVSGVSNPTDRNPIFRSIMTISVENKNYSSGMLLKCVFNSSCMYEVSVRATAVNKTTGISYSTIFHPNVASFNNFVTDTPSRDIFFNYAGRKGAGDGTMYFDLNNVVTGLNSSNINNYNWTFEVNDKINNDSAVTIKEIAVVDRGEDEEYEFLCDGVQPFINGNKKTFAKSVLTSSLRASTSISDGNISPDNSVQLSTKVSGGTAPYTWKVKEKKSGSSRIVTSATASSIDRSVLIPQNSTGTVIYETTVSDSAGAVVTDTQTVKVNAPSILTIVPDKESCHPNETVVFTPKIRCLPTDITPSCVRFTVTKSGFSQTFTASSDYTFEWTPTEAGSYNVKCELVRNSSVIASKTVSYVVAGTLDAANITITPDELEPGDYIWVSADLKNVSKPYRYKKEVYKDGEKITGYSGQGSNDYLDSISHITDPGVYTTNFTVTDPNGSFITVSKTTRAAFSIDAKFETDMSGDICLGEIVQTKITIDGGAAPYKYKLEHINSAGERKTLYTHKFTQPVNDDIYQYYNYLCDETGSNSFVATVTDANGTVFTDRKDFNVLQTTISSLTPDKASANTGDTVVFTPSVQNLASCIEPKFFKYTVTKNGESTAPTYGTNTGAFRWTPSEAGTYTIKLSIEFYNMIIAEKSVDYTVTDTPADVVTIYYSGYNNPNIHYRTAGGSWTNVPGVAMQQSNEISGYPYKYTIALNGAAHAEVCFNDGHGSWDSRNGQNYIFTQGTYTYRNGTVTKIEKPSFSASLSLPSHELLGKDNMDITCTAANGTAPYTYKFTRRLSYYPQATEVTLQDYSSENTFTLYNAGNYATTYGDYVITAYVKDATGKTVSTCETVNFKQLSSTLTANKTSASVGETVRFNLGLNGTFFSERHYRYYVMKDNYNYCELTVNSDNTADWTPTEPGTYKVYGQIYSDAAFASYYLITGDDLEFTVTETPADVVTIYYSGYSNPNIHYRTAGGSWTNVPGVAMEQSNEISGYPYKYTIALNGAAHAEVCFNDGHNNWDSRNGQNYIFTQGDYTFSNGTITRIEKQGFSASLSLPANELLGKDSMNISCTASNGTAPYTYKFTRRLASDPASSEMTIQDYSAANTAPLVNNGGAATVYGDYIIKAYVKDATGEVTEAMATVNFKELSSTLTANKASVSVGETVRFDLGLNGTFLSSRNYRYMVRKDNSSSVLTLNGDNTADWTPTEPGTYTILGELYSESGFASMYLLTDDEIEFTVTDTPANTVTIYYKGYSTPNIHYQVGDGAWTAVPGIAMTATNEVSGCTHKYTIDLGSASYANVCFNDGHNNWDSRNGANYRFTAGTFKYSNGNITAM